MVVTATDFKTNFGKYIGMVMSEDIFITKNGKPIAKVSNLNTSAVDTISGLLSGSIPDEYDRKALCMERFSKYEIND